jgi:hypothetical protein
MKIINLYSKCDKMWNIEIHMRQMNHVNHLHIMIKFFGKNFKILNLLNFGMNY